MILLSCVVAGIMVGLAAGGRLAALSGLRLRGEGALVLWLLFQGVLPLLSGTGAGRQALYWIWVASYPVLIAVCLRNARVPGMAIATAGLALNVLVILLNSGMPVMPDAVRVAGGKALAIASGDFAHVVLSTATHLPWLADIVPIPGPVGVHGVASVGDLLLASGLAATVASAVLPSQ